MQQQIGLAFDALALEPYWKLPGQFDVRFNMPLEKAMNSQSAVYFALDYAGRVTKSWEVVTPSVDANEIVTFSGIATKGFQVAGIVWAEFELTNCVHEENYGSITSGQTDVPGDTAR